MNEPGVLYDKGILCHSMSKPVLRWALVLLTSQKSVSRLRQMLASVPLRRGRAQAQIYSPSRVWRGRALPTTTISIAA